MDLFNEWQKLEEKQFSQSINKEDIMNAIYRDSKSTISILKKRLWYKILYVLGFIGLFFIGGFYFRDNNSIVLLTSFWIIIYAIGGILLYRKYREMGTTSTDDTMLNHLKKNINLIKTALKVEGIWGLLIFPIALVTGIILPKLSKGASFVEIFTEPRTLIIMFVVVLLLFPIMNYVTKKMNDHAYGKEIADLEDKIDKIENIE